MYLVASYPRSGNHLVRFLVEYLTGRPTLGCRGNEHDVPIHLNAFPEPNLLAHVGGEPIGQKVHSADEVAEALAGDEIKGTILILRHPAEAVMSYVRQPRWVGDYPRYLRRLDQGIKQYFCLKEAILRSGVPSVNVTYENLISECEECFLKELDLIVRFLGPAVDPEREAIVRLDYRRLRALNAMATGRAWGGIRSGFNPRHYSERADPITSRFLRRRLGDKRPDIAAA